MNISVRAKRGFIFCLRPAPRRAENERGLKGLKEGPKIRPEGCPPQAQILEEKTVFSLFSMHLSVINCCFTFLAYFKQFVIFFEKSDVSMKNIKNPYQNLLNLMDTLGEHVL